MDMLQELMSISYKIKLADTHSGSKLTVVMSPKGGSGCTSVVAALGEISSSGGKPTLLWDLDTRSLDLTRALSLYHKRNDNLRSLLANEIESSRKNFEKCLLRVDSNTYLVSSELNTYWNTKFLHDPSSRLFITRCLDIARYSFSNIIIDLGTLSGYCAEVILEQADQIVMLPGDCLIGASACDLDMDKVITKGFYSNKTKILCNGEKLKISNIKSQLEPVYKLGAQAWTLPNLEYDPQAFSWASSGKTIYSQGSDNTKQLLLKIASELGIGEKIIDTKKLLTHGSLLNIKLGA